MQKLANETDAGKRSLSRENAAATAKLFGFVEFATLSLRADGLLDMTITCPETASTDRALYFWAINDEIMRVGSSKSTLLSRTKQTVGWLNGFLNGTARRKSAEQRAKQLADAKNWQRFIGSSPTKTAICFGRRGSMVQTPMGKINSYLSEENWLIERLQPPLNRSKFR